jgi:CheY-like chemotaxis protein
LASGDGAAATMERLLIMVIAVASKMPEGGIPMMDRKQRVRGAGFPDLGGRAARGAEQEHWRKRMSVTKRLTLPSTSERGSPSEISGASEMAGTGSEAAPSPPTASAAGTRCDGTRSRPQERRWSIGLGAAERDPGLNAQRRRKAFPRRAAEPASRPFQLRSSASSRDRPTVLVVDDVNDLRAVMVKVLRKCGLDVIEAASGRAALRLVAQVPCVDLLVTDVHLPDVYGPDLIRAARRAHPGLKVLIVSAYPEWLISGQQPPERFLRKPFHIRELARAVTDLVRPPVPPASC